MFVQFKSWLKLRKIVKNPSFILFILSLTFCTNRKQTSVPFNQVLRSSEERSKNYTIKNRKPLYLIHTYIVFLAKQIFDFRFQSRAQLDNRVPSAGRDVRRVHEEGRLID